MTRMTTKAAARYEVVTLGEPLLRLSPPGRCQLRRASSLDLYVVGSQLNVAANLARLGRRTAFLTKLPDNPLGLLALDACRSYGIDVSRIQLVPGGKMGVTYVEFSASPRAPRAVYDRAGSAASTLAAADFQWDALLAEAACVYTDGILPGLSAGCREATHAFITAGKRQGCLTCFDVNYREHLWTPAAAREAWTRLLPSVDVLVTNRGVSEGVFGYQGSDAELMRRFAGEFGCRVVCFTSREMDGVERGAWNGQALVDNAIVQGERCTFDIVDRYGTGDAWFSGFLHAYLERGDTAFALNFGNAMCALAHTIEGDVAHLSPKDVKAVMGGAVDLRVKR